MSLGLSHSLSRYKLKFSPDKVDTMIVQAIALLDDLDKELNTYAMRVKEWYGWHFPEMARIVNDNLAYARIILNMGMRTSAATADLAEILPEEIETAVKAAAEVSMGTEITQEDLSNIQALAEQVVGFTEYRQQLSSYLSARMAAIAPNLTALVGDLVGARLIAHAGSLMNLAKSPASTIQILGAEKALFRALKTKHDTPKYGLIYHASLVGQASGKNKGKIARVLAAKSAIGIRVDALSDWSAEGEGKGDDVLEETKAALGVESRLRLERRLAALEGKPLRAKGVAIRPNGITAQPGKWEVKEARKYNPDADGLAGDEPAAAAASNPSKKAKVEVVGNTVSSSSDEDMEDAKPNGATLSESEASDKDSDAAIEDVSVRDTTPPKRTSQSKTPSTIGKPTTKTNGTTQADDDDDARSVTLSTVSADTPDSPDSPTAQERNWQSSILGNTKDAKKARKKERHARKLALSEGRSEAKKLRKEKIARRLARKERRQAREAQITRREERNNVGISDLAKMAAQAGLSEVRYKRKLDRGEICFEDGIPVAVSKKDIKKQLKTKGKVDNADKAEKVPADGEGKKRKRVDDEGEEKKKKKKKKNKRDEVEV